MNMLTIDIDFKPSFKKKVSPATYKKALSLGIRQTTLQAENLCKRECPVRTGTLMRGHSSGFGNNEGYVRNSVEYAKYVIHGTKYQSANNYPGRVVASLKSSNYAQKAVEKAIRQSGVYD